jgi:hypothetical protein
MICFSEKLFLTSNPLLQDSSYELFENLANVTFAGISRWRVYLT